MGTSATRAGEGRGGPLRQQLPRLAAGPAAQAEQGRGAISEGKMWNTQGLGMCSPHSTVPPCPVLLSLYQQREGAHTREDFNTSQPLTAPVTLSGRAGQGAMATAMGANTPACCHNGAHPPGSPSPQGAGVKTTPHSLGAAEAASSLLTPQRLLSSSQAAVTLSQPEVGVRSCGLSS